MKRILQLFNDLQQGDCWIGLNLRGIIENIDASAAAFQPGPGRNSVWQLVNHLIYWRETVMLRLQGHDAYPPQEDMLMPTDTSEVSWNETRHSFYRNFDKFYEALSRFDESRIDSPSPKAGQTYYHLLMGALQHDAYHMGQMVTGIKLFETRHNQMRAR